PLQRVCPAFPMSWLRREASRRFRHAPGHAVFFGLPGSGETTSPPPATCPGLASILLGCSVYGQHQSDRNRIAFRKSPEPRETTSPPLCGRLVSLWPRQDYPATARLPGFGDHTVSAGAPELDEKRFLRLCTESSLPGKHRIPATFGQPGRCHPRGASFA